MLASAVKQLALGWLICSTFMPAIVMADELSDGREQPISIPAGDLTASLELLAKQTGAELVYDADQLKGIYRQGPENKFPAASEDVAAVYRELLRTYAPANIGIYGCSAGGILTAEAVAWFQKVKLPRPGAIGTFCGSASGFGGDSVYVAFPLAAQNALPGAREGALSFSPYFSDASLQDPLVLPINSVDVLRKFPPTLLIAGSRDFAVSSLFHTQAALTNVGVETELHIWDGMWHAFFIDPELPESKEVYKVIVKFFDRHLGVQ